MYTIMCHPHHTPLDLYCLYYNHYTIATSTHYKNMVKLKYMNQVSLIHIAPLTVHTVHIMYPCTPSQSSLTVMYSTILIVRK